MAKTKKRIITVTGDDRLNAKLIKLQSKEQKKLIRQASRKALKPVQAAARANAPKRSGALRRSIKVRSVKRSRKRVGSRVTTNAKDNLFQGKTYYGGFQEYGWNPRKKGTKRKRRKKGEPRTPPQIKGKEFMLRAAQSNQRRAMVIYRRLLSTAIRNLAKSG